jgi:hypothetical protein
MGIIGNESNVDLAFAPFLFQSFRQGTSPLLNQDITS